MRKRVFSIPLYQWLGTLVGISLALLVAWLASRLLWLVVRPIISRITRDPDERHYTRLRAPRATTYRRRAASCQHAATARETPAAPS